MLFYADLDLRPHWAIKDYREMEKFQGLIEESIGVRTYGTGALSFC